MPSNTADFHFPLSVRAEWASYIASSKNKQQLTSTQYLTIVEFIQNPYKSPRDSKESKLKWRAGHEFRLTDGKLYHTSSLKGDRLVVQQEACFDVLVELHLELGHYGRDKMFRCSKQRLYGVTREDCQWIHDHCSNCKVDRAEIYKVLFQPSIASRVFERIQMDLFDMRYDPDGPYTWILHIQDHFSYFTMLFALKSRHAVPIANAMEVFIMAFGIPNVAQTGNIKELKGALLIILRRSGYAILDGAPQSPQVQELVEQGKGVVEAKIEAWKKKNESKGWRRGLMEVCKQINSQPQSRTKMSPYEIVFRERGPFKEQKTPEQGTQTCGIPSEVSGEPLITEAEFAPDELEHITQEDAAQTSQITDFPEYLLDDSEDYMNRHQEVFNHHDLVKEPLRDVQNYSEDYPHVSIHQDLDLGPLNATQAYIADYHRVSIDYSPGPELSQAAQDYTGDCQQVSIDYFPELGLFKSTQSIEMVCASNPKLQEDIPHGWGEDSQWLEVGDIDFDM